ncbi:MAG: hypothetical protein AABX59_01520 [Nanoarchaeota archaeon]
MLHGKVEKGKKKTGKVVGIFGSTSGAGAVAGAHNVCHSICTAAVSVFAIFGITVSSTALMFLEDLAPYFWIMGLVFFTASLFLFIWMKHGSKKFLLFNAGILIAGIPFSLLSAYQIILWTFGGLFVLVSLILYINERRHRDIGKND